MNQESWETIILADYEYDELIVADGQVYADAIIESVEELADYSALTPNEVLKAAVEGLLLCEEEWIQRSVEACQSELELLGIEVECFDTDIETEENIIAYEYAKFSISENVTYCVQSTVRAQYDLWGEVEMLYFEFLKIKESEYEQARQSDINRLEKLAAKHGYQLIPA